MVKKQKLIPKLELTDWKLPFPYKDGSVEELVCNHLLHRIPGKLRGQFMDEAWRVLKPEGKMSVIVPYWSNMRAVADFGCEWPPINELSFCYFNRQQRSEAKIHLDLKCNFELSTYGYTTDMETTGRSQDVQPFWNKHYTNSVVDLQVNLIKRP